MPDSNPVKRTKYLPNHLFICSRNQWRSPTAELLFKNHPVHQARSAGTSEKARIRVTRKLIDWADVIFVMESRHRDLLRQKFLSGIQSKELVVLHIEDKYQFGDVELVEILKDALKEYL